VSQRQSAPLVNRESFARDLAAGHGRAALWVHRHGLDGVADLVLAACLSRQGYDPQCEGGRADWLYRMFRCSAKRQEFEQAIAARLLVADDDGDLDQLFGLACLLALDGCEVANQALWQRALALADQPDGSAASTGADALLKFAGLAGFKALCQRYVARIAADPDDSPPALDPSDLPAECWSWLTEISRAEPCYAALQAQWKSWLRAGQPAAPPTNAELRAQARKELPLDKILAQAANRKLEGFSSYMRFGRFAASDEELAVVLERCVREPDPEVQMRLLWVFRRVAMPRVEAMVLAAAESSHAGLRKAAIAALSQCHDERIAELARTKLSRGELLGADCEVMALFERNWESQDLHRICAALGGLQADSEDVHAIACDVLVLAATHPKADWRRALAWVYDLQPCAICRRRAVQHLLARGELGSDRRSECAFDADEEIRQLVTAGIDEAE